MLSTSAHGIFYSLLTLWVFTLLFQKKGFLGELVNLFKPNSSFYITLKIFRHAMKLLEQPAFCQNQMWGVSRLNDDLPFLPGSSGTSGNPGSPPPPPPPPPPPIICCRSIKSKSPRSMASVSPMPGLCFLWHPLQHDWQVLWQVWFTVSLNNLKLAP